jgi:protein-tyrosine-phosphatase
LFVCCGNRERSVIAERLLQQKLVDDFPTLTKKVKIGSAGIVPKEYLRHAEANGIIFQPPHFGKNPNVYALQYLTKKGIDISSYRSRELTENMVMEADLILAIDRLIKEEVLYVYPEASGKVFTFKEFVWGTNCQNPDIGDPMKLPEIDEATGIWIWPEGYPDHYIAEIEQCLSYGIDKFIQYIRERPFIMEA